MSQFNNYFEDKYDAESVITTYPDISNLWPVNNMTYSYSTDDNNKQSEMDSDILKVFNKVSERLENQKYLTEGDILDSFNFKSTLSNPYHFYEGDADTYRTYLLNRLEECRKKMNLYRREVRLIEEALKEMS